MTRYREVSPSPRLAQYVECFWTLELSEAVSGYPVLPDGCVDFLFARDRSGSTRLDVIGAMTRCHRFDLPAGQWMLGGRFHAGTSPAFLRAPASLFTDKSFALSAIWGATGEQLRQRLGEAASASEGIAAFEAVLAEPSKAGPVQRAVSWLVENHGAGSIEELAALAGLSPRQFRRLCVQETGLTPKRLARILRFRRAASLARRCGRPNWARLAIDCGYYDQAHLVNEFREFSGLSPGQYASRPDGRSFQDSYARAT